MNLFDIPQIELNEELTTLIMKNENIRVERIISTGQTTDWYEQDQYELVFLLSGNAKIEYENKEIIELKAGDTIKIPKHKRHRVAFTSKTPPCVWLCIFYNSETEN